MKSINVGPIHHDPYGGFEYSLLTPGLKPAYKSTCKEYILDVYYYSIHGISQNPYPVVPVDRLMLFIKNSSETAHDWAGQALKFMNQIEKEARMGKTKLFKAEGAKDCYVFEGAADWLLSPPLLSFFAVIPRIIKNNPNISLDNIVKQQLRGYKASSLVYNPSRKTEIVYGDAEHFVATLCRVGPARIFGEDKKENWTCDGIHGWGIISYVTEHLKQYKPEWYDWQKDYAEKKHSCV